MQASLTQTKTKTNYHNESLNIIKHAENKNKN
jgi:hypothetical protein